MSLYTERHEQAKDLLKNRDMDALLLLKPENLYYFTGFWGAAPIRLLSLVLPRAAPARLLVPKLEEDYARSASAVQDISSYVEFSPRGQPEDPVQLIGEAFRDAGLSAGRIGLELDTIPTSVFQRLSRELPAVDWVDGSPLVNQMRMVKTESETEKVRRASRLVDLKAAAAVQMARPGMTELELGIAVAYEAALDSEFVISPYNAGVPVIAAGARSALPHGRASTTKIQAGDFLVIDLCAVAFFEGYHAGFTRTVVIGEPTARQSEIYEVVHEAHGRAVETVEPGIPVAELDHAARSVIEAAGYGGYFTHRTGRGVGLDVAEPPYLRQGEETRLVPGMTISIEPGIYIAGYGGVRIEDTVLVTDSGAELLTDYPRELINALDMGG